LYYCCSESGGALAGREEACGCFRKVRDGAK
jgi:hypothetical protein